jgi:heat shock protein HtpX
VNTLKTAVLLGLLTALFLVLGGWGGRDERGNPFVLLVTALVAPIVAVLIQLAVSRSREYQTDATGAELAPNPNGLASALEKLETAAQRVPMQRAHANSNHLFIVPPGAGLAFKNLFRTHPPTRDRIRRRRGR